MRSLTSFGVGLSFPLALVACAPPSGPEDPEPLGEAVQAESVQQAADGSCSTASVKGLSLQIAQQGACIEPGSFVEVPAQPNVTFTDPVLPFLEQPARDAFLAAVAEKPNTAIQVNSMLRTVAQQYLLYKWYQAGTCGISLAATPGNSNHETGLAMDIQQYDTWKTTLQNHGFKWYGAADVVHFDYIGPGAVNYKGTDVLAFQMLWNKNHPDDLLVEDGDYGPQTEARLKQSPADGFPLGPDCSVKPPKPDIQLGIGFADASDAFADGASEGRADLFEGDTKSLQITLTNSGDAPATNVDIVVEIRDPWLTGLDYVIESDFGHPGTFEVNDANAEMTNPEHGQPLAKTTPFKMNAFAKGETKRLTVNVRADIYSIEPDGDPEVHFWVKDVPDAYHQDAYGAEPNNIDASQTFQGGVLELAAPADIYSQSQWLWDTDRREGWSPVSGAALSTNPELGFLSVTPLADGLALQSAPLSVSTDAFAGVEITGRITGDGQAFLYFATDASPAFDDSQRLPISLASETGEMVSTVVGVVAESGWTGTLTQLGIGVEGGGTLELDSVRLVSEGGDIGEGGGGTGGTVDTGGGGAGGADLDDPTRKAMCNCELPGRSSSGDSGRDPAIIALFGLLAAGLVRRRAR